MSRMKTINVHSQQMAGVLHRLFENHHKLSSLEFHRHNRMVEQAAQKISGLPMNLGRGLERIRIHSILHELETELGKMESKLLQTTV